jgi:hypothetical protein
MKQLFIILFLSVFIPLLSIAQSNYKPGYVVTTKGDTLKGFIDYREWDINPRSINFKSNGSSDAKSLTPADITFFNVNTFESYQKYSGKISRDETAENRVLGGRDTSFFTDNVFLRVLQQGKVINLFSYIDAIKPRYFYSDPTDNIAHELVYRIYFDARAVTASRGRTVNENTYLQQLSAVALKAGVLDDKMQSIMNDADYNRPILLKIVTRMNGLSKADLNTNNADDKSNFDLYAGLGVNAMTTKPHANYLAAGGKPYTSYLPKALIGFNAYANPNTRKLVFSVELAMALAKYKSVYDNKVYPYQGILYTFNQTIISIEPQVSYNFYNADNFKFYATIGYDLSRLFYANKKFVRQDDGTDASYALFPFFLSNKSNSVIYKAGFLINKKIQIYADYVSGNGISYDGFFSLTQSAYQIGINYLLGKQK